MKSSRKTLIIASLILVLAAGFFLARSALLRRAERLKLQEELAAVTEYTGVLDAEELSTLDQYPNLQSADLRGSSDIPAILAYAETRPEVRFRYTVTLGDVEADSEAAELVIPEDACSLPDLTERLCWLPALRSLQLDGLSCAPEELDRFLAAFPQIQVRYSVRVLDRLIPGDAESLDLSELSPEDLEQAISAIRLLPALKTVDLTNAEGENYLDLSAVAALEQAYPEILFRYRFSLFGKELSTEDSRLEFLRAEIGNDGVPSLREALLCMPRCEYCLLDDCGIDYDVLAELRESLPRTKIVWRVHIGYLDFLTDVKIIHLTFLLTNRNAQVMRYCNEVEYLDIGHNKISDISFMAYMPHLKYVILSYNHVSDLSPLASCKELQMLELYQCLDLQDISPLAECESLELLNISWTDVKDIRPVYGLKNLKRLYCIWNYEIPQEQMDQAFVELPDCWVTFEEPVSKNIGWSFDAVGAVRAQWYLDMYQILRYRVEPYFFGDYPEGWNQEEHAN